MRWWRQLHCVICGKYLQETLGTVFPPGGDVPYGSSVLAEEIIRAVLALSEGVSPTVQRWDLEDVAGSERSEQGGPGVSAAAARCLLAVG